MPSPTKADLLQFGETLDGWGGWVVDVGDESMVAVAGDDVFSVMVKPREGSAPLVIVQGELTEDAAQAVAALAFRLKRWRDEAASAASYSIGELESLGFSKWTIRYYVTQGIVPAPSGRGQAARYSQKALDALYEARSLASRRRDSGLSLADLKVRLNGS